MSTVNSGNAGLTHQQVFVNGAAIHVVTGGVKSNPPILFLHGFPENWAEFERVMLHLKDDFFVLSIDLPGIGSSDKLSSADKKDIAAVIRELLAILDIKNITLAGHDVGGMIVYSCLKAFHKDIHKAIIMNVVVPGVEPWSKVKQNPMIWHFNFHKIKGLPETLVKGRQRAYFDYFFDTIAKTPSRIDDRSRNVYVEAYTGDVALQTGFDWYRSFEQDEKDNLQSKDRVIGTPVLYVRGDSEHGNIDDYLAGFRESGIADIRGNVFADCGHYSPEEAVEQMVTVIREFVRPC